MGSRESVLDFLRHLPFRLRRKAAARIDPDAPLQDPEKPVGDCACCGEAVLFKENIAVTDSEPPVHGSCDRKMRRLKMSEIMITQIFMDTIRILRDVPGMDAPLRRIVEALPDDMSSQDLVRFIAAAQTVVRENTKIGEPLREALVSAIADQRRRIFSTV